jgi:hypothetical protein
MNGDDKKRSELLETMLSAAKLREPVQNALAQLFPKAETVLRTFVPRESDDRNGRKRQRRLSEKDFAPAYFRLDPQPASWSRSEIESILNSADPGQALTEVESRVRASTQQDRSRLRRTFLEALDGAFDVRRPFSLDWFRALVDFAPSYVAARDDAARLWYTFDNADRLRWVVIHALRVLLPENRAQLILAVIPQAADVSLLCDVVRTIARDRHEQGAKDELENTSFGDSTETIRSLLLERVRSLAQSNQIWMQSQPDRLLWFWWGCDLEAEVKEFTKRAMNTEEGLRGLLDVAVSLVQSSEGDYEHVGYSSWSRIVDLEELAQRAKNLMAASNESDRRLAQRFLDALEKGRKDPF